MGQLLFPNMTNSGSRRGRPRSAVDHGRVNRREVYEAGKPRHSGDRKRILELLEQLGPGGATRYELSVKLNMNYTTVSGRVTDLKKLGAVEDTAERRLTPSGSTACVVVAVSCKTDERG